MARLAAGTHPDLALEPEDSVVFSSRTIPGNERPVFDMVANAMRKQARLHTRVTDPDVHTSGHATRAEQAKMLDLIRPRCFLPVHGTLHHLRRHAELAMAHGVREVKVVENGTSVLFDGRSLEVEGSVPAGRVAVGFGGIEVEPSILHERAELARSGIAMVAVVLGNGRELVRPPSVSTRGVAGVDDGALRALALEIARVVETARKRRSSNDQLEEEVRRAVRRRLLEVGGVRPVVDVHVIEQGD
jgi:ribonuclease J